jgi:hypothetical protein
MCKHLLQRTGLGFFSDTDDPSNPYPDAWCPSCERLRGESGEFDSDYARATFKLVYGACYQEIKAKNLSLRSQCKIVVGLVLPAWTIP